MPAAATSQTARRKPKPKTPESEKRRRTVRGVAAGAGMLVALAGTSYGSSSVNSASPATIASAPQSFPPSQPCSAQGDGRGDPALNVQKNRFTGPSLSDIAPDITTPANMINLAQPSELKPMEQRANWPNDTAVNQLRTREGQAVTIVGYLVGAKEENTGGGESCNCHEPQVFFDYHLYMADQPRVPITKAVVVEMTPRWRAVNRVGEPLTIATVASRRSKVSSTNRSA